MSSAQFSIIFHQSLMRCELFKWVTDVCQVTRDDTHGVFSHWFSILSQQWSCYLTWPLPLAVYIMETHIYSREFSSPA